MVRPSRSARVASRHHWLVMCSGPAQPAPSKEPRSLELGAHPPSKVTATADVPAGVVLAEPVAESMANLTARIVISATGGSVLKSTGLDWSSSWLVAAGVRGGGGAREQRGSSRLGGDEAARSGFVRRAFRLHAAPVQPEAPGRPHGPLVSCLAVWLRGRPISMARPPALQAAGKLPTRTTGLARPYARRCRRRRPSAARPPRTFRSPPPPPPPLVPPSPSCRHVRQPQH